MKSYVKELHEPKEKSLENAIGRRTAKAAPDISIAGPANRGAKKDEK